MPEDAGADEYFGKVVVKIADWLEAPQAAWHYLLPGELQISVKWTPYLDADSEQLLKGTPVALTLAPEPRRGKTASPAVAPPSPSPSPKAAPAAAAAAKALATGSEPPAPSPPGAARSRALAAVEQAAEYEDDDDDFEEDEEDEGEEKVYTTVVASSPAKKSAPAPSVAAQQAFSPSAAWHGTRRVRRPAPRACVRARELRV